MQKPCDRCGTLNPVAASYCRHCGMAWAENMIRSATRISPVMMQWRTLNRNMTRREVRKLLGEPLKVDMPAASGGPVRERWTYEYEITGREGERLSGQVEFAVSEGTLTAWMEPDWDALSS